MELKVIVLLTIVSAYTVSLHAVGASQDATTEPEPRPNSESDEQQDSPSEGETESLDRQTSPKPDNVDNDNDESTEPEPETDELSSESVDPETEHSEYDEAYPEGESSVESQDPDGSELEETPFVENGFIHLPFAVEGPVPNDYFLPLDERSEMTEAESEQEVEYWWENEPEYFYDDEYAYLNSMVEAEEEAETESEVEPENEAEPEYEAEPEGEGEPMMEYTYTFKGSTNRLGVKRTLHILIGIVSMACGSSGVAIIVILYRGHKQYREAKLGQFEGEPGKKKPHAFWEILSRLSSCYYGIKHH